MPSNPRLPAIFKLEKSEPVFIHGMGVNFKTSPGIRRGIRWPPDAYSFDVEKTDSIVSPYIGTAEFNVKGAQSKTQKSQQEAERAPIDDQNSYTIKHKFSYAYQDGHWALKLENCNIDGDGWSDCYGYGARHSVMTFP